MHLLPSIFVTASVFHFDTSWLNTDADANMKFIVVTASIFHFETSELNAVAEKNMPDILVTALVFHFDKSALKLPNVLANVWP